MDPLVESVIDISDSPAALKSHADMVLERARWASQTFQRYDRERTQAVVRAVAEVAYEKAAHYAQWAVDEAGFGVVEHKVLKNQLSSVPLVDHYESWDFVNPRIDEAMKIVEIPKPAGVVFALVPSTNPISTVYFKVLSCLMTRNAVVMSPHPAVKKSCVDAAKTLAEAAVAAGAPESIIQVIEEPSIPLVDQFMKSDKTDVILATGGTPMVRAAYSSANPAIGVGPGNAPCYVDDTADLKQAAKHIVESKSFDNSVLCTNESVVITLESVATQLRKELERANAYICDEEETDRLRRFLFHDRGFNVEALGQDATWIAQEVGIRVPPKTKILVTPIDYIGVEEKLSKEKLCPVLGFYVASSPNQALRQARALLRLSGAGHSAAIHSEDSQAVMDYAAAVEVYRVVTNAPCSQGAAGFATNLAPTFTIGTGFFGRSSIGENVGPQHLVNWTRIAYHADAGSPMGDFLKARMNWTGPLPQAPADGVPNSPSPQPIRSASTAPRASAGGSGSPDAMRDEIRRIIAEELRAALKG